mgnify:CR=1 FL=1
MRRPRTLPLRLRRRFNGAAARELRMRLRDAEHVGRQLASMGPQLVSCGCIQRLLDGDPRRVASMGPQLVSCGCRVRNVLQ